MTYNTCCPFSNDFFGKILIKALGKTLLLSCPFSDDFFGKIMGKILRLSCPFSDEYLGKILGKLFGKTLGKISTSFYYLLLSFYRRVLN